MRQSIFLETMLQNSKLNNTNLRLMHMLLTKQKIFSVLVLIIVFFSQANFAQKRDTSSVGKSIYDKIKAFSLTGGKADVNGLVLKRDRVTMTFSKGTFFFASPVDGKFTGAVFLGEGNLNAEIPPSDFEKAHVKRLLGVDSISSTFKTAVLRFSDNTYEVIGKNIIQQSADERTQELANQTDIQVSEETGANIPARLTISIINGEKPGFFFASFSGGKRGSFHYVFDPQTRIPTAFFDIDGGEKGLIYSYDSYLSSSEVWTAFYSLQDYKNRTVTYSDMNALVDIEHYKMDVDLRNPKSTMDLTAKVKMKTRKANLRAIPFSINEDLRLKSVWLGAKKIDAIQEDLDNQLLVFLPEVMGENQKLELEFKVEGDFMRQSSLAKHCYYPLESASWYPQHDHLDRSTFEFTFIHPQELRVVSVGVRKSEGPNPEDKKSAITKYEMKHPVALVTFAMGPFESHKDQIKWDSGNNKSIPLEFNSLPGAYIKLEEEFILAELNNSVRYFNELFGSYPYDTYGATFHPYDYGEGFPSMVMIPDTNRANKNNFVFISHETAHQWWGNTILWRSYRDLWLSEGFAEYSGILYVRLRDSSKAANDLIKSRRKSLKMPPHTTTGLGKGRLNDAGPIILGRRLDSSKTYGAYQGLVYNKGALVLRMIHFLFSNPSNGDDKAFYKMMKDFVKKYKKDIASTDDFREVANAHFANTPLAKKYRLKNMNWFFSQWIYKSNLPSYKLEYSYENQPNGAIIVKGNLIQEDVPKNWFMPIPITFRFGNGRSANGTIHAYGHETPFRIKLPEKPKKVELDPQLWVLSAKNLVQKLK